VLLLAAARLLLQAILQQLQHDRQHRWSTPSHMIAICMARQPHPTKLMPLWEELAACACAVQNMHLMATSLGLAAYWSSWHGEARDSVQMLQFLGLDSLKGDR
jgi:nitroreductase